jgi:hypothetical protein
MTKYEDIAKYLKTRLSKLTGRVAEIDSELRKPLFADSEERATDLENQDALESIKNSEMQEIHRIQGALKLGDLACIHDMTAVQAADSSPA